MSSTLERLRRLSAVVAAAQDDTRDAITARNTAIADADAEGHPVRAIAAAAGISYGQVQRVVIELTEQRQAAAVHTLGLDPD